MIDNHIEHRRSSKIYTAFEAPTDDMIQQLVHVSPLLSVRGLRLYGILVQVLPDFTCIEEMIVPNAASMLFPGKSKSPLYSAGTIAAELSKTTWYNLHFSSLYIAKSLSQASHELCQRYLSDSNSNKRGT